MSEQDLELLPIVEMRVIFSERTYTKGRLFWKKKITTRQGMRFEARRAYSNEWIEIPFFMEELSDDMEDDDEYEEFYTE